MPTKPKGTKDQTPDPEPADRPQGTEEPAPRPAPAKTLAERKKEALSLFDAKPKRKRAKKSAPGAEEPPAAEPAPPKRTLDDEKKDALSLFEESERRAEARRTSRGRKILGEDEVERRTAGGDVLPPISLLKASEEEARSPKPRKPAGGEEGDEGAADSDPNVIHIKPPIIVKDLAERMGLKPFLLIKDLIELDVFADTNKSIEPEIAAKVCEKHGFVFEKERREKGAGVRKVDEVIAEPELPEVEVAEEMQLRAPVVTLMGHVDHGKTSLLDAIRKSEVAAGEAGGITQHVAAYRVEHQGRPVTFLDTPGHAAFTAMRARGAQVTDIVVLVVAADDGIMPQTEEAINHAKAAGVKIMVALNKIDLPGANPDRVLAQLQERGLAPEAWGGQTSVTQVSALKGTGIDELLELIALEAEVLELKANPGAVCRATVIESRVLAGKGPTASVIIQNGTMRPGMPFICGPYWGKIKQLIDDHGRPLKEAGPADPVEVLGFSEVPHVGDEVVQMDSERSAKRLSEERLLERRQAKLSLPKRASLESLFSQVGGAKPALRLVLKTDVQGSIEAIVKSLEELPREKVDLNFLHTAAGAITESDILLASASDAVVLGFNTKVEGKAARLAKAEGVQVKLFSIIYELIDQVKEAMLGLLKPEHRETVLGHAEIKQVFKTSKGRVGGCLVTDGRVNRTARARVVRDGVPVYDGSVHTLKRYQDEVPEVRNGLECGIKLGNFNDYEVGDIIECYELELLAQSL